ncbi:lytic murein transglycosylase [Nocardioides sp.]|uniref:lytic transglycosylase domain-containing protein n=1 Tax=Nocardioides sp. TaxID=35761 RepID=UPI002629AD6E|nr:lytic murein transglycosylase [Nocardioides sp.]MDI6909439.1 lytic murein transglycosylase [Nocardioides sp.]
MPTARTTARFGRGQKIMALVPLALLSAAWTASIAGVGASTATASAESQPTTLPDGSTVPTEAIQAPASVSTAGGVAPGVQGDGARIVSTAATSGIPSAALAAYQRAETVINAADKSCQLSWQLIAAIGRVESDHGRTNGNTLDAQGVARPGIYGLALDGTHGTSRITDTDAGQYDADARFDRAIGPMQFIPSTWSVVGVDADGDGERNPQDIDDAALATAVYLCSGSDDLSTPAGQRAAVYRYNHSSSYVDLVLSIAAAYLDGEFTSVPNGTTSAGYLVPAPAKPDKQGPKKHHGQPHATQTQGPGGSTEPSPAPPEEEPTPPAPSPPAGGGGIDLPAPSVPPLPSTSVTPVDELLTVAQAIVQCTLDGYVDNVLKDDDPFDQCVYDYTHR